MATPFPFQKLWPRGLTVLSHSPSCCNELSTFFFPYVGRVGPFVCLQQHKHLRMVFFGLALAHARRHKQRGKEQDGVYFRQSNRFIRLPVRANVGKLIVALSFFFVLESTLSSFCFQTQDTGND